MLDGLALVHAQRLHKPLHPVGGKDAHQAVFHGEIEARDAGISLTTRATAQLVVDTPGLVPLSAQDMQAARGQHFLMSLFPRLAYPCRFGWIYISQRVQLGLQIATQHDIGAAAGHIGGDGHHTRATGLCNDLGLFLVVLGVEHFVFNFGFAEARRHRLGRLYRSRADQHRSAFAHALFDISHDGIELFLHAEINQIIQVGALRRHVGWNHQHVQAIDLAELEGLCIGRPGHPGQFVVKAEVILERGRSQCLALFMNLNPFLGLNRLMQTLGQSSPGHGATGVLIDQDHFPVLHNVLDIPVEQRMSAQAGIDVVQQIEIGSAVEVFTLFQQPFANHQLLDIFVAGFRQLYLTLLLVDGVMPRLTLRIQPQHGYHAVDAPIEFRAVFRCAGDNQRRARLIDQNGIHFVDNGKAQSSGHTLFQRKRHIVAQVIKTELVIRTVDNICVVSGAFFLWRLTRADHAEGDTEEVVERPHPVGVAMGQVIIYRNQVDTITAERVEVGRQCCHQSLAFAGAHLGYFALV